MFLESGKLSFFVTWPISVELGSSFIVITEVIPVGQRKVVDCIMYGIFIMDKEGKSNDGQAIFHRQ